MITGKGRRTISAGLDTSGCDRWSGPPVILTARHSRYYNAKGDHGDATFAHHSKGGGLSVVDHRKIVGLFGHRVALRRLMHAAVADIGETAAEQPQFRADQRRGGNHGEPGLRSARRRLHLDPRIYDAEQRDEVY